MQLVIVYVHVFHDGKDRVAFNWCFSLLQFPVCYSLVAAVNSTWRPDQKTYMKKTVSISSHDWQSKATGG